MPNIGSPESTGIAPATSTWGTRILHTYRCTQNDGLSGFSTHDASYRATLYTLVYVSVMVNREQIAQLVSHEALSIFASYLGSSKISESRLYYSS